MEKNEEIAKKMMKAAISKKVNEALEEVIDGLNQFAGDLTKEEGNVAAEMVLDWIKEAAVEFDSKSRAALDRAK